MAGNSTKLQLPRSADWVSRDFVQSLNITTQAGLRSETYDWYKYDAEGRVLVGEGYSNGSQVVAGKVAGRAKGYTISYDVGGRRTFSEQWTRASGQSDIYLRSEYVYSDNGYLISGKNREVLRTINSDSSHVVQSQANSIFVFSNYYDGSGARIRQTTYDSLGEYAGEIKYTYRGDGLQTSQLTYKRSGFMKDVLVQANYFGEAGMIDAAGNQASYRYVIYNADGLSVSYKGLNEKIFEKLDAYKEKTITASASINSTPGRTQLVYGLRGDLKYTNDGAYGAYQGYLSNRDGQLVARIDDSSKRIQNYLYYQGAALANVGTLAAAQIADTYTPVSSEYPARTPSSYPVSQGDTLAGIALTLWGDAKMWYLIADANGIDPSKELIPGSTLRIPNVISSTHNDSTTFKPYNANEVIGDTTPTPIFPPPPKPKKKKCNAVASIVMVVVAVVVTIFTAGAGLALAGGASLTTAAAAGASAVMAGGIGVGLTGTALSLGAVAGSIASQAAGKAMGVVDKISWKQAAVAGISTGTAGWAAPLAGATAGVVGSASAGYAVQGVIGYASSQLASKIVGLESSFSWSSMAASAIGSIVAGSINQNSGFWNSTIRGQISAHSSAWMRDKWFGGGRPDHGQVAADAFGNALADYALLSLRESGKRGFWLPGGYSNETHLDRGVDGVVLDGDWREVSDSSSPGVNRIGLTDEEVYRGRSKASDWFEATIDEDKKSISVKFVMDFDTGDLPGTDATRLKGLFNDGASKFWSRPVKINGNDYQVDSSVVEREGGMPMELRVEKDDPYIRSYNSRGEGFVAALVSLFVGSRVYYNDAKYLGRGNAEQLRDNDFKLVAAHEMGHAVLTIAGGISDSWGHVGTSSIFGGDATAKVPMPDGSSKVDLMRYYTWEYSETKYPRAIASESDVKSLIYISSRR